MIIDMIKTALQKEIDNKYPHIKQPQAVLAKVTSASSDGEWYTYTLKILDKKGVISGQYPEIPNVYSKVHVTSGKTVAILLLYGELNPFILGEVH